MEKQEIKDILIDVITDVVTPKNYDFEINEDGLTDWIDFIYERTNENGQN
jgi:hypothetical protein